MLPLKVATRKGCSLAPALLSCHSAQPLQGTQPPAQAATTRLPGRPPARCGASAAAEDILQRFLCVFLCFHLRFSSLLL